MMRCVFLLFVFGTVFSAGAFVAPRPLSRAPSTACHFFGDAWKKAFSNQEFMDPPEGIKASARHILVPTLEEADMVMEQLSQGDVGFSALAEQFSTCPSGKSGGMLGSFKPGTMVPEFDKVIFDPTTTLGAVVGPVRTTFGYHLIVVDKRTGV